uniref:Reelin domain-containing protein n=1 Tax=Macrostomum lignano TaxID=282301 RepID=A0A1I8IDJ7_9PLAT
MSNSRLPMSPELQMLLSAVVLLSGVHLSAAFPDGAPNHRCSNLVPMHGFQPQTSAPPYELTFSPDRYSPGQTVQVTLRGTSGQSFLGFALAARRVSDDTEELVGGFEVPTGAVGGFWYSQNASLPNCLTHSGLPQSEITARWTAPPRSVGDVVFTTFWSNVTSSVLTAVLSSEDPPFPPLTIGESPNPLEGACGTEFGCVRSPALCDTANCEILVKFLYLEAENRLRLLVHAVGNFVSLGLSDDDKMGDDLTLTCTGGQGGYSMQLGYNPKYRRLNERHRWTPMQNKYIELLDTGRIRCDFTLPWTVNIRTYLNPRQSSEPPVLRSFDLRTPRYVFVAYGNTYRDSSSVQQHTEMPAISTSQVNLQSRDGYSAHRISGLRRAHGSLMLTAWQFLMPLGANLALFYRCLFMKSYGNVQLWFHMYSNTQSHGAMGLTIVCLTVVQILMGALRPDKDSPKRPWFKIAHQIVAYTALSLAEAQDADSSEEKDSIETAKFRLLRLLFGVYLAGMLIIFLTWLVTIVVF